MPGTAIRVSKLVKQYGRTGGPAISDISFDLEEGGTLGFLGRDGAGKSTLLRILAGITPPTSGAATVAGFDVGTARDSIREVVGYLPQMPVMLPGDSVRKYLEFWAKANGLSRAQREKRVDELIDFLDLGEEEARPILDCTTFVQRRVFLAMTLLPDPPVLLLDEPCAGMSPTECAAMYPKMKALRDKGKTVLITSTQLQKLQSVCDLIITMAEGRATKAYPTQDLLRIVGDARHARAFVETDAPGSKAIPVLRRVPGVLEVREGVPAHIVFIEPGVFRPEEMKRILGGEGIAVRSVREAELTIGDVFRTLTQREAAT